MKILVEECSKDDRLKYFSKDEKVDLKYFLEIKDEKEKNTFVVDLISSKERLEKFFDKMFSVLFFYMPELEDKGIMLDKPSDKPDEDT